jgi:hypothetical protein
MNLLEAKPKQEFILRNGLRVKIYMVTRGPYPTVWAQPITPHPTIRMIVLDTHGKLLLLHSVAEGDESEYDIVSSST